MKTIIYKCFQKNVNTLKKVIRHTTDDLEIFSDILSLPERSPLCMVYQ